jgi:hypothetical protein
MGGGGEEERGSGERRGEERERQHENKREKKHENKISFSQNIEH